MKSSVYVSCNCDTCRRWSPSKVKGAHKRRAHRELRREGNRLILRLIRYGDDTLPMIPIVSTGYKT